MYTHNPSLEPIAARWAAPRCQETDNDQIREF